MPQLHTLFFAAASGLILATSTWAGKLSIVIDDFGYRPLQENQVLALPASVSVAVLPNAPHAHEMATKAHQRGHEVLIHLPMAPLSQQPLEKDTLRPDMSSGEITRIIREAVNSVPYAVGMNNHMGSAMTSSLSGMQKVMHALEQYDLYFLDSLTIGNSQAAHAAAGTRVKVIKRNVFLDDIQNEADIRFQFNRAIQLARKTGSAIAIGHPHPTTVRVLQQMVYHLPADITLVRPGSLLNEPQERSSISSHTPSGKRQLHSFHGVQICKLKQPIEPVDATTYFNVLRESITGSTPVKYLQLQWEGLAKQD